MTKWLLLPVIALAYLAGSAMAAAPRDSDGDGIPNRWEKRYGLSVDKRSAKADRDKDGLANRREFRLHTNPRKRDTDRDGLRDGAEVRRYKTNPLKRDTDRDGYSDLAEIRAGTNPRSSKSHPSKPGFNPAPAPGPGSGSGAPAPAPGTPPTPSGVGVPAGWSPAQTRSSELVVTQPGAVVQDVLLQNANLVISAPNVTVRRVKLQGGMIENFRGSTCSSNTVIEDSTIEPPPGAPESTDGEVSIGTGGYTARRVLIWQRNEGFRAGGNGSGCGPVQIENSFAKIVIPKGRCDMHSDGIQGYDGPPLTVVNSTIDFRDAACGTAPYFVPHDQGNTTANVNGLLIMGGGYPFRQGVPGSISGLKIVDKSWGYGPLEVKCNLFSHWDASIVNITADYQVSKTVRALPCG